MLACEGRAQFPKRRDLAVIPGNLDGQNTYPFLGAGGQKRAFIAAEGEARELELKQFAAIATARTIALLTLSDSPTLAGPER